MGEQFTHFDAQGKAVMVDVTGKVDTHRRAIARGRITMSRECFALVQSGTAAKGDVLGVARVAGIMAVKHTPQLIPLCHAIPISNAAVEFVLAEDGPWVEASCTVATTGPTGVEMEALTGVTAALLTVYDMCKAVDKTMEITAIRLAEKSGGKSGVFRHPKEG